jgi:hypothetical protein
MSKIWPRHAYDAGTAILFVPLFVPRSSHRRAKRSQPRSGVGGLAKPNALLEQIWNTLLRSVLAASHTSANCHLRNSPAHRRRGNPSRRGGPGRRGCRRSQTGSRALELNQNSTPVTSRKPHRRSRSAEPAIPSAGAAHLYHRLTITTLRLGAWTLMLRARAALSAAGLCSLGSMNCPLCKPSTAMAAKCCSTFRRKLVFRESPCLCSRETD